MARVDVAIWNVQNFGGAGQDDRRGLNGALLARVIRAFVDDADLDVLFLMEVLPGAQNALNAVLAELNNRPNAADRVWCYDWIKGAVADNKNFPPRSSNDLSWRGGPSGCPRVEGYAIFWRSNQAAFDVAPAVYKQSEGVQRDAQNPTPPNGTNFLELIIDGLELEYITHQSYTAINGYDPTVSQLLPFDDNLAKQKWKELNFPWATGQRFPAPTPYDSRRPAFAILALAGQNASGKPCPLICYHAPSEEKRAEIGTYCAALSRQLFVTNKVLANGKQSTKAFVHSDGAIIGGDFNFHLDDVESPDLPYSKFLSDYDNDIDDCGANLSSITPDNLDERRTTVQLNDYGTGYFNGAARTGNATADYLSMRIDQLMYRGLTARIGGTRIYPFLDKLMLANGPFEAALNFYAPHFVGVINASGLAVNAVTGPQKPNPNAHNPNAPPTVPIYRDLTNWNAFYADLQAQNPVFTTARSAAEFFHIFVSDHLPLTLSFKW